MSFPSSSDDEDVPPKAHRPPLPVTIAPGMQVIDTQDETPATIVAFTQGFCLYRHEGSDEVAVAAWRDVALCGVTPAQPLLPASINQIDRDNASTAVLRELLALRQFGLTAAQTAALEELTAQICGAPK